MSTRSFICVEQDDGSYKGVYCHWDGYLTYNGAMLLDHYNSRERAEALIALGDLSLLCEKLYPDPDKPHGFDYDKRQPDVTVAYARDRGEKNTEARIVTPESALDSWGEYLYVFCKDGKWRYYALCDDQPELRDVETDLAKEFEAMGIERPKDVYGFFPQERIDQLKKEQAKLRKNDAVM